MVAPRPQSNSSFSFPASTRMLGPKRSITGRGAPVPKSVTLRFCEDAGAARAMAAMRSQTAFGRRPLPGFINLRVRRFGLLGNVRAGCHELNNRIGKLRGPGFAAYIASPFVFGAINLFQAIVNHVGCMMFAQVTQHQLGGADDG